MLIMSWFEPLAGITSDHQGSVTAPLQTEALAVCWGHEQLVGCRADEPCHPEYLAC